MLPKYFQTINNSLLKINFSSQTIQEKKDELEVTEKKWRGGPNIYTGGNKRCEES